MDTMQDFSNKPVPEDQGPRFKWLYLTNVENAVTVCVPVFLFGASLGTSLTATTLLMALGLAALFLSLLTAWTSYIGTKTRLSTSLLAQKSFGTQGVKLVWILLAISLFGWFGVQTEIFAKTFLVIAQKTLPDVQFNPTFVTVASGLLMASTAVIGIKGIGKLAQLAIPLLLGVMAYALAVALSTQGLANWFASVPQNPMSLGSAIAAIIGGYSVGVIVMPDVKRFAKDTRHSIVSGVLSIGISYPLLLLCTALTCVLLNQPDYLEILVSLGLGTFSLFILLLATWTSNDLNLYSASLSLAPLFPKLSRAALTAISGIIGTALATMGLFEKMIPLFMLLGVFTMPLLAIYSFDFIFRKTEEANAKSIVLSSFIIWIAASFVGVASTPTDQLGLGLFPALTTVSGFDALLVAVALCAVRLLKRKATCCAVRA